MKRDGTLPRAGANFILRRLSDDDLSVFQAYRHDVELGRYQGWSPMTDAEAQAFLLEMASAPLLQPGSWTQIGIAEPDNQCLIGDVGLFLGEDESFAEIGFTLARKAQGRGVATAAICEAIRLVFECSAADRLIGITDSRNLASVRLLERVGMRKVETRNVVFRDEPCVELVYQVFRGDRHG